MPRSERSSNLCAGWPPHWISTVSAHQMAVHALWPSRQLRALYRKLTRRVTIVTHLDMCVSSHTLQHHAHMVMSKKKTNDHCHWSRLGIARLRPSVRWYGWRFFLVFPHLHHGPQEMSRKLALRNNRSAFHEKSERCAQRASARTHLSSRCSQQSSKDSELHRPWVQHFVTGTDCVRCSRLRFLDSPGRCGVASANCCGREATCHSEDVAASWDCYVRRCGVTGLCSTS